MFFLAWQSQTNCQVRISLAPLHHSFPKSSINGLNKNCLWIQLDRHTTIQPVRAVYPSFASHSRRATTKFVLRGISGKQKPLINENYALLTKVQSLTKNLEDCLLSQRGQIHICTILAQERRCHAWRD